MLEVKGGFVIADTQGHGKVTIPVAQITGVRKQHGAIHVQTGARSYAIAPTSLLQTLLHPIAATQRMADGLAALEAAMAACAR